MALSSLAFVAGFRYWPSALVVSNFEDVSALPGKHP